MLSTLYLFLSFFCFIVCVCVCVFICGSFMEYNDHVEMRISWKKREGTEWRRKKTYNTRGFAQLNGILVQFTPGTLVFLLFCFFLSFLCFSCRYLFFFRCSLFHFIPSLLDIWSDAWSVWMWWKRECSHRAWSSSSRMNASLVEISHIIISIYQKRENIYIFHYLMRLCACVPLSARNMH